MKLPLSWVSKSTQSHVLFLLVSHIPFIFTSICLDLGADVEWPPLNRFNDSRDNESNDTPLLAAVRNGHSDVAALLLAHGADPFRCTNNGNSVMHLAASSGDEAVASLFAPNAEVLARLTNKDGMSALDIAVAHGYTAFAEFLTGLCEAEVRRAPVNCSDSELVEQGDSDYESVDPSSSSNDAASNSIESSESTTSDIASASSDLDIDQTLNHHEYSGSDSEGIEVTNAQCDQDEPDVEDISRQLQHITTLSHTQSIELYQAKYALNEAIQQRDSLDKELKDLKFIYGQDDGLNNLGNKSLAELTSLEEQMKASLDRITKTKEELSKSLEEERTCVICRENTKTVLLMTCRHLCVCSLCGHRDELTCCPLCREIIVERINVFQ